MHLTRGTTSVEGTTVNIGICNKITKLFPLTVVMKHSETFFTEETRVTGSKLIILCEPPVNENWRLRFKGIQFLKTNVFQKFYKPSNEDVADCTLLGGYSVLVDEQRVKLLIQTVVPVCQSVVCKREKSLSQSHEWWEQTLVTHL